MTFLAPRRQIPPFLRYEAELRINLASLIRRCGHELRETAAWWISEGTCPFCDDPSASFKAIDARDFAFDPADVYAADVDTREEMLAKIPYYTCRRCHARGTALGFWMRRHNARLEDALEALCDEAGIPFAEEVVGYEAKGACELARDLAVDIRQPIGAPGRVVEPKSAWERAIRVAGWRNEEMRRAYAGGNSPL